MPFEDFQTATATQLKQYLTGLEYADEKHTYKEILDQYLNPAFLVALGRYFYAVIDIRHQKIVHINGDFEQVMGDKPEKLLGLGVVELSEYIHPEDKDYLYGGAMAVYNYLQELPIERRKNIKVTYICRILWKNGRVIRFFQQDIPLVFDSNGNLIYELMFISDISHLDNEDKVIISLLDISNEQHQRFVYFSPKKEIKLVEGSPKISKREKEIISLIAHGLTTKQIAQQLDIAYYTVLTHRKNIFTKMSVHNDNELISFCLKNGII